MEEHHLVYSSIPYQGNFKNMTELLAYWLLENFEEHPQIFVSIKAYGRIHIHKNAKNTKKSLLKKSKKKIK